MFLVVRDADGAEEVSLEEDWPGMEEQNVELRVALSNDIDRSALNNGIPGSGYVFSRETDSGWGMVAAG